MITFIDIIKEKIKFYIRSSKLETIDVNINEKDVQLFKGMYHFYADYFEFKTGAVIEKLYYNSVDRVSVSNKQVVIETINHKSFSLKEDFAFVFIEILRDILQSRDNIFQILKMNDNLTEKQILRLAEGESQKVDVSDAKEAQIKLALLIEAKKYDEARNVLTSVKSFASQNVINYFSSYLQKSEAKFENKPILHYDSLIPALKAVVEDKHNVIQLQNLINTYIEYQENFFSIPQDRRKFIIITDEFYGVPKKGFLMLLKNYNLDDTHSLYHSIDTSAITIPEKMSFPVGHPIINNVYVVHPFNDKFYIPVEQHEEYLFNDRIDEFKRLMQALGATEIKFSKEHRLKVNQDEYSNLKVNVDVGIKAHSLNVDYNNTNDQNNYNNNEASQRTNHKATPTLKPYIPSNLFWYPKETTWQHLYEQRRVGGNNLSSIEEVVKSKSHKTVSSNELTDINVGLKVFFVKAAVHVKKEIKSSISEEEEMVQKISVTFAPINELTQEYIEEKKLENKQSHVKINYKNKNTELIPVSFIENRKPKILPSVIGKNIRIPISEENNVYLDMIYVEGGTYWMGIDDPEALKLSPTSTLKQVTVDSFYICKYLINNNLRVKLMNGMDWFSYYSNAAVSNYSKLDCIEFIKKVNNITNLKFELPNEHQWEYAARGGRYSKGYKYAGSYKLSDIAMYGKEDKGYINSPVGNYKANELGIHDMSGLVNEWCSNEFDLVLNTLLGNNNETINIDGIDHPNIKIDNNSRKYSILRGGTFKNSATHCTVYHKFIYPVDKKYEGCGFRLILPVSEIQKLEVVENKEQLVKVKE